jgi:hypothetical protein
MTCTRFLPWAAVLAASTPGMGAAGTPKSLSGVADPAARLKIVTDLPECDEYLPTKDPCSVKINMRDTADGRQNCKTHKPTGKPNLYLSRAHWDVTIKPAGEAAVWLFHSSPFLACTVAATPAVVTRDVTASLTAFLGTAGTLGAIGSNPKWQALTLEMNEVAKTLPQAEEAPQSRAAPATTAEQALRRINQLILEIHQNLKDKQDNYDTTSLLKLKDIKGKAAKIWVYQFDDDNDFSVKLGTVPQDLHGFIQKEPIPNMASIQGKLKELESDMISYRRQYDDSLAEPVKRTERAIDLVNGLAAVLQDHFAEYIAKRAQLEQQDNVIQSIVSGSTKPPYTNQILPMAYFSQKQVTEAITCKDVVSQSQTFDVITFTAYYENFPRYDFSAGPLVSLLGAHTVGTVSGPLIPAPASSGSTGPPPTQTANTVLGVTNSSRVQVLPTAFAEFHPINFHCPGVQNGAPTHPFGYACSLGLAGGFTVNPYNSTTTAEFFEGISIGIQRVALFVGFHNGRYQEFSGGYYAGETSSATGITPPTMRRWTTHPAFGISYRIPLH